MRNTFLVLIFAMSSVLELSAQANTKTTLNPTVRIQEKVYQLALENNDLEAATMAVYQLIAIQPEKQTWQDTLCLLYHGRGYYSQSASLALKIIERNPETREFREVLAQAYEYLGNYSEALEQYELLVKPDSNSAVLYKTAMMHYMLKDYKECESDLKYILSDKDSESINIATQADPANAKLQAVPIRAAALNMLGVIYMDDKKSEEAKEAFEAALKIFPAYLVAKQNIKLLKEAM
jgi:tetratricopeptide (TPR) repeat protein